MGDDGVDKRPQLVLDIAGVLITNLSPIFWSVLAVELLLYDKKSP